MATELAAEGFDVVRETTEDEAAPDVIVAEGAATAGAALHRGEHVLAIIERHELGELPDEIAAFIVLPLTPGELSARLRRVEAQSARDRLRHLLSTAVHHAESVIEIADGNGRLEYVNPTFTTVLGFELDEVIGRTPAELLRSGAHAPAYYDQIQERLRRGETWRGRMISRARDGRMVHFDTTLTPVMRGEELRQIVAVKADMSERVRREALLEQTNRALTDARDAALAASRSKSEFLANMSHELRTPLNAIIGYSELLLEDESEAADHARMRDLRRVREAGRHLLELIDGVLDLSRIETGRLTPYAEVFELDPLIQAVVTQITPAMRASSNTMVTSVAPNLGTLHTDRRMVRQILTNLLANAAKFTHTGTVTLTARLEPHDDARTVCIEIRDTGIGIAASRLDDVFRPFVQADASTTRRYGGSGLGLSIVRELTTLLGGTVSLDSEPDVGSAFTVRIPARWAQDDADPKPTSPRVLVIDDEPDIHAQLQRILEPAGFRMTSAFEGHQGIALARRDIPDLILLDVRMPELDGWSVLTRLRVDATTCRIPVIILSGVGQREVSEHLGADAHLDKPIRPGPLLAAVRRCHHRRSEPFSVLLVEDDEPTRELFRRSLERAGFSVQEARSGEEGLSLLQQGGKTDLVVLDLMMPDMDGFEVLERMRAQEALRGLPVLVATAKTLTAEERAQLTTSAHGVVEKNAYTRAELVRRIGDHVGDLTTRTPPGKG